MVSVIVATAWTGQADNRPVSKHAASKLLHRLRDPFANSVKVGVCRFCTEQMLTLERGVFKGCLLLKGAWRASAPCVS